MKSKEKPYNDIELEFINAFELYNDALFRFAVFKLSSRERAIELVQDTYLKAWNYIISGNKVGEMRAFLYKVLNNLIIDEYRKKQSPYSLDEMQEKAGFDIGDESNKKTEDQFDGSRVLELLKNMSPNSKEVLTLKYVEDLSIKEIAKILKENENTISVRIHRALNELKGIYREQNNE